MTKIYHFKGVEYKEFNKESIRNYIKRNDEYKTLTRYIENILLRPNDCKRRMGEERFNMFVEVVEDMLQNYKQDKLYEYYYELPTVDHGFCNFERWKAGLLF